MQCPQCQHENREGAKFCEARGSPLDLCCPACDNEARPHRWRGAAKMAVLPGKGYEGFWGA